MYVLDPARGRRRRALIRDKAVHATHESGDAIGVVTRDARHRGRGLIAETRKHVRRDRPDDREVIRQVRTEIGAVSRHPGAIGVDARDGVVVLSGLVLAEEADRVLAAAGRVRGVESVEDRLDVRDQAGNIPSLQGQGKLRGRPRPELLQQHWAPAPRMLAGAAGGGLAAYGLARRDAGGLAATAAGTLAFTRAATNMPMRRLTGVRVGRGAVEVDKSINVMAPVEDVWAVLDDYGAFPTFMTHVRDVSVGADGRSHWKVDGPLGTVLEWDAEVTERRPHEVLAWRSCPGAAIRHAGELRLEPFDGGSRVHVRLSYNPVAGAAGHAVARLLGTHPRKQLDEDLLRLKTMIETGARPHDAAAW